MKKLYFILILFIQSYLITAQSHWVEDSKIKTSDATELDLFGFSVSVSGDYMVASAFADDDSGTQSGSVYVFRKSSDNWEQIAKLYASDGHIEQFFGYDVAISGDIIVVGTRNDSDNPETAYLFQKPASGWNTMTETAKLTASDRSANDWFGKSVDVSEDAVIIGAIYEGGTGSAYIFEKPNSGWVDMTETAKLTSSDRNSGDEFGYSVSIDQNTVAIGAPKEDFDADEESGSVYIFTKPVSGWTNMNETAILKASGASSWENFGHSVAIDENVVVVGSLLGTVTTGLYDGKAFVFEKPASGWVDMTETAKLLPAEEDYSGDFAESVAISGNWILVGAPHDSDVDWKNGAAFIFEKQGSNWTDMTEKAKLLPSSGGQEFLFGYDVDMSGNHIVMGSHNDDFKGESTGSAYIFDMANNGPKDIISSASQIPENLPVGQHVATLTSVNHNHSDSHTYTLVEGFGDDDNASFSIDNDKLISTELFDFETKKDYKIRIKTEDAFGYTYEKVIFLEVKKIINGPNSWQHINKLLAPDGGSNDHYGTVVSIWEDYAAVGAPYNNPEGLKSGAIYIYKKIDNEWSYIAKLTPTSNQVNNFPISLCFSEDIIVAKGIHGNEHIHGASNGVAYVFEKPNGGWIDMTQTAQLFPSGDLTNLRGEAMAISGDYIVFGSDSEFHNGKQTGAAYLFQKPPNGWANISETAKLYPSFGHDGYEFGQSADISGDQIVIGANGAAFVFEKPETGWHDMSETAKLTPSYTGGYGHYGHDVAISGNQIVVGAYSESSGIGGGGVVYVYEKPETGWVNNMSESAKLISSDISIFDDFGYSVAISDNQIVVGARSDYPRGSAYVFNKPPFGWQNMTQNAKLTSSDGSNDSYYGISVDIKGDQIIVGAMYEDQIANKAGAAYIYEKFNHNPSEIHLSDNTFPENLEADTYLAAFSTTDEDQDDIHYYTLIEGQEYDNEYFYIDGSNLVSNENLNYEEKNTFNIRVQSNDSNGGIIEKDFVVTITDENDAPVVATAIENQIAIEDTPYSFQFSNQVFEDEDEGEILTFSASLADGNSLPSWLQFDSNTSAFSGTPTNNDVGFLNIKVTATDSQEASIYQLFELEIENTNDVPVIGDLENIHGLCPNDQTSITIPVSDDDGDIISLSINSNLDGLEVELNDNNLSIFHGASQAGKFTLTLIANDNNGGVTEKEIEVELYYLDLKISQNENQLTASAGADTYQWYLDGIELAEETNQTIIAHNVGEYTVEATYSGDCHAASESVFIDRLTNLEIDISDLLKIYPNPANDFLYINTKWSEINKTTIKISNLIGREVLYIDAYSNQLDISKLPKGIYFLQLQMAGQSIAIKKFIKQ